MNMMVQKLGNSDKRAHDAYAQLSFTHQCLLCDYSVLSRQLYGLTQHGVIDLDVSLCGCDVAVPSQLRQHPHIHTAIGQGGDEGAPS